LMVVRGGGCVGTTTGRQYGHVPDIIQDEIETGKKTAKFTLCCRALAPRGLGLGQRR